MGMAILAIYSKMYDEHIGHFVDVKGKENPVSFNELLTFQLVSCEYNLIFFSSAFHILLCRQQTIHSFI